MYKIEKFYKTISAELHDWLIDKAPETLSEATKLADELITVINEQHVKPKPVFYTKRQCQGVDNHKANNDQPHNYFEKQKRGNDTDDKENKVESFNTHTNNNKSTNWCNYCRKTGHTRKRCWKLKKHDS